MCFHMMRIGILFTQIIYLVLMCDRDVVSQQQKTPQSGLSSADMMMAEDILRIEASIKYISECFLM